MSLSAQKMLAGMGVAGDGVATADIGEIPQTKCVASSKALSLWHGGSKHNP